VSRRDRLLRLKRYTLLYASFTGLLRSNFDDAFRRIDMLHCLNRDHFPPTSPDDPIFDNLLHLLVAIQNHYAGRLDAAKECYSFIPPTAGDTYILALLNKSIILRLGTQQDYSLAMKSLDEVERRLAISGESCSPQLRNAWCLVKGITSTEVIRSKLPRKLLSLINSELLSRVLHMSSEQINGQLRTVALTVMATRYYINTSTEHAEKMGLMAYIGAKKAKDDIWQLVSGNLLSGSTPSHRNDADDRGL
jgi:hypothetical protein